MLIGEYRHTLDAKKRIAVPSKFRKELGKKVVITHGLDNCLFVYPMKQWERLAQSLAEMPMGGRDSRGFNRFILAGAVETDVDSAGRILIPDYLKQFAGLGDTAVVMGVQTRVEIWAVERWEHYRAEMESKADELAEKLGEIGMV